MDIHIFSDNFQISEIEIEKAAKIGLKEICGSLPQEACRIDVVKCVLRTISEKLLDNQQIRL